MLAMIRRPLAPAALRLLLPLRLARELDHGEPQERFVAVGQDIDVIGVEHAQVDPHPVRPRDAEQDVLAVLVDDLALVGHRDAHPHGLEGEARVVAVDVGEARARGPHHLPVDAAREDAELPPEVLALVGASASTIAARLVVLCG